MDGWTADNEFELLENGEEFFPKLFADIDAAVHSVVFETYIFHGDEVGQQTTEVLKRAARRGVKISVTVDDYGSPNFSQEFAGVLSGEGVIVCLFDCQPTFFGIHTNVFCRLHRKIVVIDRKIAFVGGINIWAQQLRKSGPGSMHDYAVRVTGPVVDEIHKLVSRSTKASVRTRHRSFSVWRRWRIGIRRISKEFDRATGNGQAHFVTRDNSTHPSDIEVMYRVGLRSAKQRVIIANAYFFPSYRLLRDLARTARRGVDVKLIVQGRPDIPVSAMATTMLYGYLRGSGVKIFRYNDRALHAKVAVIDGVWSTVGSSNLDPISLGLNLEANLVMLDRQFAAILERSLESLLERSCEEVSVAIPKRSIINRLVLAIVYLLTRRMSFWGKFVRGDAEAVNQTRPAELETERVGAD